MSSIAVAGLYDDGIFTEDMFDEGQKLAHPYHRTKFESEKLVRERVKAPFRIYRPSDRRRRQPQRRDGQDRRAVLLLQGHPEGPAHAAGVVPADRLEWGWTNIVPVDYVAAAVDHIAHEPDLDGQTFHVVDPKGQRVGEVLNTFAEAGHAPKAVMRIDRRATQNLPKGVLSFAHEAARAQADPRPTSSPTSGIPDEVVDYIALTCRFDARDTTRALRDSDIEIPPLADYADEAVGLLRARARPGPLQGPLASRAPSTAKRS